MLASSSTLSRSDLHSSVHPPVNAFGKKAITTGLSPKYSASWCVLPSDPSSLKSGARSPISKLSAAGKNSIDARDKRAVEKCWPADRSALSPFIDCSIPCSTGCQRNHRFGELADGWYTRSRLPRIGSTFGPFLDFDSAGLTRDFLWCGLDFEHGS